MKILLTGVSGYIGKRLLLPLLLQGHQVTCCVRRPETFKAPDEYSDQVDIVKIDFSEKDAGKTIYGKFDITLCTH